jgi:hypothetical protein
MLAFFGTRRTISLMGWCVLFSIAGVDAVREMRHAAIGSTAARYQAVTALALFADHLRGLGYDLGPVEEPAGVQRVIRGALPA